ncbi:DUF2249 domain-containing protein [Roseateles sp.]|uniref:DUF2249 domain-containing protein n=1 Tax=Roseateles sp. TaxID=1971397 RepID=UPI0039E7C01F
MAPNTCSSLIDLREFARETRPGRVSEILNALGPGESTELIDDVDPTPLLAGLRKAVPGQFTWNVGAAGTGLWLVRLDRLPAEPGEGRCCGACGGS